MDAIMDQGGNFELEEIRVGRHKDETSYARLKVLASDHAQLQHIIASVQDMGAELVSSRDAQIQPAPWDGVLPEDFSRARAPCGAAQIWRSVYSVWEARNASTSARVGAPRIPP